MRAIGLALVVLLTWAGSAQAQRGLPPAEKDQARKAYVATQQIHQGIENFAEALRVATGPSARSALSVVWQGVQFHAREAGKGALLLIGVNTAMFTFAEMEAREALPRATWVTDAFASHDSVLGNVSFTVGQIDAAIAVGGQPAGYYTALNALKTNFSTMQSNLAGLNRTLPYSQARNLPFCRAVATAQGSIYDANSGSCNVFGPHGNWIMATWGLNQGWQELITAVLPNLRLVYTANDGAEATMPDSTNGPVADMLVNIARLSDNLMVVVFNFAAISTTPTQCGFTPLRLVMRTIERLLQFGDTTNSVTPPAEGGPIAGNPFFWAFRGTMASTLDGFNAALASRPVTHGLFNTVLSDILFAWRVAEGGFWFAFEMPSDLRNVIIGGTLGPPNAPAPGTTVFPYYFGVARSSELRVYVKAAGGTTDRIPLIPGANSVTWGGGTATVTVAGIGNPGGGTVTITPAPPTDYHVEIERIGGTRLEELRRQPYPENDPAVGTVGPCS